MDSQIIITRGLLNGDIDEESSPLLYYRRMLKQQQSEIKLIPFEDLTIGKQIGVGGYGEVSLGRWKHTDVAVKKVIGKTNSDEQINDFLKEVSLMSRLNHPNIVLFMGACVDGTGLYIITEYVSRGSLHSLLHGSDLELSIKRKLKILIDSARGMLYLHSYNPTIIHRDLKSQNLLVDKYWNCKVCDFGLSRIIVSETMSRLGTIHYSAPEVLRGERYTEKADIFSFAIVIWEVLMREIPYDNLPPLKIASDVAYRQRRPEISQDEFPELVEIIERCWEEIPEDRPDFSDICDMLNECSALIDHVNSDITSQNKLIIELREPTSGEIPFNSVLADIYKNKN